MRHVFIVGSKGIPTRYGGFETFVDKLTEYQKSDEIKYHVAAIKTKAEYDKNQKTYEYNGAHCFNIKERISSSARAIFYDLDALNYCIKYIKENSIESPIIYVLACRIGPVAWIYKRKIHKLGGVLLINPDGHEWKRSKWNKFIRKYWKYSEKHMVKNADLLVCDNKGIEDYINEEYKKYNPATTYIAYGAETSASTLTDDAPEVEEWFEENEIKKNEYYLTVGRFVPENNFKTILKEFMKSNTSKDLVVIADYLFTPLYKELIDKLDIYKDSRIKFVGTLYNHQLLKKVRESAYAYIHGHSVGGTNPSLLEALGRTELNLVYDVSFNKEVAGDGALYWTEEYGLLSYMIEKSDKMTLEEIYEYGVKARNRVDEYYSWEKIRSQYEKLFLSEELF